ncbi:hypothetical protein EGW08_003938 [Elysia chlorotica]|uniref:Transmembrane protein n=1 Tax=Elysia chlorotica TaxID=188477 RepID=A0A3S1CBN6_ELYCH|nr:hypothetical protein EGW08_003938 [Elysia chlorotica]
MSRSFTISFIYLIFFFLLKLNINHGYGLTISNFGSNATVKKKLLVYSTNGTAPHQPQLLLENKGQKVIFFIQRCILHVAMPPKNPFKAVFTAIRPSICVQHLCKPYLSLLVQI